MGSRDYTSRLPQTAESLGHRSIPNEHGQGMSEKEIAHAFEKFYQGDGSRLTHGNGLRLSLVKRIIDMHHGTIRISSKPEEMTTFTVTLP